MTLTVTPRTGHPRTIKQAIYVTVCTHEHLKVYLKGVLVPTIVRQGEWKAVTIEREEEES